MQDGGRGSPGGGSNLGVLRAEDITRIHKAAIAANLKWRRELLLGELPPGFRAALPNLGNPTMARTARDQVLLEQLLSDQLLSDLDALNQVEQLQDGTVPLAAWLSRAESLASAGESSATFRAMLERIQGGEQPEPSEQATKEPGAAHKGSCLCGAVSFEVTGALPPPDACHCSKCRKQSGHFFASTDVPRAALTIHGAEKLTWFRSSEKVRRGFCSTCGSALFWDPLHHDWIGVAMGAFDQPTETRLRIHIFVADKGDYYDIADGVPQNQQ